MPGSAHPPRRRAELERWAASGCRVSRAMLDHDLTFAEAIDLLAGARPRPAVVYDIADYRPPEDPR